MYRRPLFTMITALVPVLLLVSVTPMAHPHVAAQQANCQTFVETGKSACGKFLAYWQEHGSLDQQGYPITNELNEVSEVDGKTYLAQYFERAVFELHPENPHPYDVLLSLLGSITYARKYPNGAPGQRPNDGPGSLYFAQTGKRLGGKFLDRWKSKGGLMQQGYPISDEFQEKSELDGKVYTVQYFERAVFELHPENNPPYDVLLSQLGTFQLNRKNAGSGSPQMTPTPSPTPGAFSRLRERPLKFPALTPGGSCPTTHGRKNVFRNPDVVAFGIGPVYLLGVDYISDDGKIRLAEVTLRYSDGAYGLKGQWVSRPEYPGPVLVRGRQLGEAKTIIFHYGLGSVEDEMRLNQSNNMGSSDWSFWPSAIVIPGRGCYGFQIDGLDYTDVIVLEAVGGQ